MSKFESRLEDHAGQVAEAEATLRLVARQPAPEGVAERVHGRLQHERQRLGAVSERNGVWHLWLPAHRLQFAGAAALAAIVAISTMSVRHTAPKIAVVPAPAPVPNTSGSGFRSAASQARPGTLTPIPVPAQTTKKKKPSAGHTAKHTPQRLTQGNAAAPAKQ